MSRIQIDEEGFELVSDGGEPIAQVVWLDLDRVEAHNVDLISLDFFSGDQFATVTEDDFGFEDLAPQLIANLDLEDPDWFQAIQRPGTERLLIYDREEGY
jgi:hypothetical protein